MNEVQHPVIFFDGVCNLCSASVQFVIRYDPDKKFRFASLQSQFAADVLSRYGVNSAQLSSIVLLENGVIHTKSAAVFSIARHLKVPYKWIAFLRFIPFFISNKVYDFIAANRYRWFGKKTSCWLPTPQLKSLFLDQAENA